MDTLDATFTTNATLTTKREMTLHSLHDTTQTLQTLQWQNVGQKPTNGYNITMLWQLSGVFPVGQCSG